MQTSSATLVMANYKLAPDCNPYRIKVLLKAQEYVTFRDNSSLYVTFCFYYSQAVWFIVTNKWLEGISV